MAPVVGAIGRRQERMIWGNLKRLLEPEAKPGQGLAAAPPRSGPTEPTRVVDLSGRSSVLVAYASAHGSTKGIAERIAARLSDREARVEVRPVGEVEDIDAYDSVILGSAVYGQSWIPDATAFLRRHADELALRRVWLFSVGSFGDTYRGIGRLMNREPRGIAQIQEAVHPRTTECSLA